MRKRNHTVTIRMNEKEYALLQQKIKASGQTQQAVILAAIENVDLMSAEVKEELNVLNQAWGNKPSAARCNNQYQPDRTSYECWQFLSQSRCAEQSQ